MTQVRPTRPTPEPVSSDDFEMIEGGVTYTPHAGETVTALRGVRIGDFKLLQALAGLQVDIQALEPEENASMAEQESARMKQLELMVPRMEEIGEVIRARVLSWTWTMPAENGDLVPMPQPKEGGVELLTQEEAIYLLTVIRGETEAEEGKDSNGSPTISSAIESQGASTSSDSDLSPSKESSPKRANHSEEPSLVSGH